MDENACVSSISGKALEAMVQQPGITFVDFWAEWCAPCRNFAPVFARVAEQFPDIRFVKVNLEEEQELADMLHIQSIPHLMVFKNEIAIYSGGGSLEESILLDLVQQAITADVSGLKS